MTADWGWFTLLSLGVAGYYIAIQAPVLDPPNYLDPWIYTASFVNFGWMYHAFGWTYYPSRLPWVIPGIVVHALFGPLVAFFVLHVVFFFGAGLFAYLLFRHFFGVRVALAGYAVLMLCPIFYDAYSNDYPDGALLTYLFGGIYFGLTANSGQRPWLRAGLTGFFLAAAVGTNLFAGVVIFSLLLLYAVVRRDLWKSRLSVARELAAGAAGALLLFIVCGSFSVAYGGPFVFFRPQINALSTIHAADYKAPGASWVLGEPQLLLPPFVVMVLMVLLLAHGRRHFSETVRRFAVGAAASAAVFYVLIVVWEFGFTGDFLETSYYFSMFNVGIALCLASVWFLIGARGPLALFVGFASITATTLTLWVHLLPDGRHGAVVTVALMAASVVVLVAVRWLPNGAVLAAAALVAFTATYAADAGTITRAVFARGTYSEHRDVQAVGLQLISFMRRNGLQKVPFQFWYDAREDPALNGIQSTYLWGDTWVGLEMPKIDAPMRRLLRQRKPSALVFLCARPSCHRAPEVLAAAGYANRPLAHGVLAAGSERVYVRAVELPEFAAANRPVNETLQTFRHSAAPFAAVARGRVVRMWSFAHGLPTGWGGDAAAAAAAAHGSAFDTSSGKFVYELVGTKLKLTPGSYTLYGRGHVLAGGLDLGVLDADHNSWIAQRLYWYGQRRRFGTGWMATPFTLSGATTVQVILSNWQPAGGASRWQVGELRLARTP